MAALVSLTVLRGSSGPIVMVGDKRVTQCQIDLLRGMRSAGLVTGLRGGRQLATLGLLTKHGNSPAQYRITQLGYDAVAAADEMCAS